MENLRKNSVIALALLAGISLSHQPLHAEWTAINYAEVATAALRGVLSSFEYKLKKDDSTSAHFKRLLISALRVTHGVLSITNHSGDYPSYYLHGLTAFDGAQGLVRGAHLVQALIHDDGELKNSSEENLPTDNSVQPEPTTPEHEGEMLKAQHLLGRYLNPALESLMAIALAFIGGGDSRNQIGLRVTQQPYLLAQSLLFHCRTLQIAVTTINDPVNDDVANPENKIRLKRMIAGLLLANLVHTSYQLLSDGSDFNAWIRNKVDAEEEKERLRGERIRMEWEEAARRWREEEERLTPEERAERRRQENAHRFFFFGNGFFPGPPEGEEERAQRRRDNVNAEFLEIFPMIREMLEQGYAIDGLARNWPFEVLGLDENANLADVNQRYNRLALAHHPDRNPNGHRVMQILNGARDAARERFER